MGDEGAKSTGGVAQDITMTYDEEPTSRCA